MQCTIRTRQLSRDPNSITSPPPHLHILIYTSSDLLFFPLFFFFPFLTASSLKKSGSAFLLIQTFPCKPFSNPHDTSVRKRKLPALHIRHRGLTGHQPCNSHTALNAPFQWTLKNTHRNCVVKSHNHLYRVAYDYTLCIWLLPRQGPWQVFTWNKINVCGGGGSGGGGTDAPNRLFME